MLFLLPTRAWAGKKTKKKHINSFLTPPSPGTIPPKFRFLSPRKNVGKESKTELGHCFGDRKSLSIAKNHPKPSQEFSEQFGPSIHKIKGFRRNSPRKVHPNFAENLGREILGNTFSGWGPARPLRGLPGTSGPEMPKKSRKGLSGPPAQSRAGGLGRHFRDFFGISGLEGPRDLCKGRAGSQFSGLNFWPSARVKKASP